jgi:hypothetical protein
VYTAAIRLVSKERRQDVFGAVLGPMRDLMRAQIMQDSLLAEVEHIIATMEDLVRGADMMPS